MKDLEKMHVADIIALTNLYLTPRTLLEIWKEDEELEGIPQRNLAKKMLLENLEYVSELVEDEVYLYQFLVKHDQEIDRFKLLMALLINYKERLSMSGGVKIPQEELEMIRSGIAEVKRLLKGINRTVVHYNVSSDGNQITNLTIINTKEELEGKNRKERNNNAQRLENLEKDIDFIDIMQSIFTADIEYSIAFDSSIGSDIRYMIEYNTVMREYKGKLNEVDTTLPVSTLASKIDRIKFLEEMARALELHIEEINFDKLLLCSAYRFIEGIEQGYIRKDAIEEVRQRLIIMKKHMEKNPKLIVYPDISYTLKDLESDLARFICKEKNTTYLSKEEAQQLIEELLEGKITLTSLGKQIIEALQIDSSTLSKILQKNPNNYIYFLLQEKNTYSKSIILKDIINAKICSSDLLKLLCEKADLTPEEISDLFDKEIITVSDLKAVRENTGVIITDNSLFEKYRQYKENPNKEENRIQFERYVLAYRNTEILGKAPEEVQSKAEEFMGKVGEEIELSDLVTLYGYHILPLKVVVDWGGEEIIEELLQSGNLKPADARYLRDEGLLNEEVLERLFQKCRNMAYSDQVSLVSAVFDGQTPEEQQIRERLAQYYNIEKGINNFGKRTSLPNKKGLNKNQDEEPKRKIKMRDPGAKYNFLASVDKDVTTDSGIVDGHIIFHYPNIDDGIVLIEKLHKITTNKKNGMIEIKPDNESATYIMSEEEFINMKFQLIQDGKIDRTQLTQKWWVTRDPEHWIPHNGTAYWEKAIMQRFNVCEENPRYSIEDINRIQELKSRSIESKKNDERDI